MGKNHDLLVSIKNSISSNYLLINSIPVEDVINSVCYELNEIKQIYDTRHYSTLQKSIISYAGALQEAKNIGDGNRFVAIMEKIIDLHDMIPDIEVALPFIETANYDRALNRHILDNTIIAMGDSHSCFFSGNENLSLIPIKNDISTCEQNNAYPFTVLHLGPCLAYNSDRYGSQNRLREKIEWLDENFLLQGDTIITSLGEIDVRTQVYKHVNAGDGKYTEVIDDILPHYGKLLNWLKERGYRVICYGAIGSLKDDAPLDDYRPRIGTEKERNCAGRYYNERLEELCHSIGIEFFTLFYDMVNGENLTDKRFLSVDEFHLGGYGYQLAINKLKDLGVLL